MSICIFVQLYETGYIVAVSTHTFSPAFNEDKRRNYEKFRTHTSCAVQLVMPRSLLHWAENSDLFISPSTYTTTFLLSPFRKPALATKTVLLPCLIVVLSSVELMIWTGIPLSLSIFIIGTSSVMSFSNKIITSLYSRVTGVSHVLWPRVEFEVVGKMSETTNICIKLVYSQCCASQC